jgi:DNA mismatch repair protein MutL
LAIRVLDADSAAKIAAGEVVERPASVAKELIENAIDAGASQVRVELKDGGISLLRVVDDGCGLPAEELPLAFQRHATSKIGSIDDLPLVATLGFRGEALPSIAAVSQVTLASRQAHDRGGSQLVIHGGEIVEHGAAGCPAGSSVTVRELFYNTPARRKFLKTPLAEGGQVTRLVGHFALAYPGIAFSLTADGRPVLQSAGNGDLLDVIARLYGPEVARGMIPVELDSDCAAPPLRREAAGRAALADRTAATALRVRGYVSQPQVSRASRSHISLFVNGRLIQGRALLHAAEEAYSSLLMVGRHPVAVLNVSLDPAQVDVNVHPSKAEVKFAAERQVLGRVHQAVRQAVARYAPVPVIGLRAPVVGSVPGPAGLLGAYAPPPGGWPGVPEVAAGAPPAGWAGGPAAFAPGWLGVPGSGQPGGEPMAHGPGWPGVAGSGQRGGEPTAHGLGWPGEAGSGQPGAEPMAHGLGWPGEAGSGQPGAEPMAHGLGWPGEAGSGGGPVPDGRGGSDVPGSDARGGWLAAGPAQAPAGGHMLAALPMLRVLGQLALTYIIAEGPGGLYLIDQHAAHERVRLDAIERSRQNDTGQAPDAQLLLQPLTIEVSPAQAAAAAAAAPALSRLGIAIEPFGDRTWLLRAIPAAMRLDRARQALGAMLDELAAEAPGDDWDARAAHSLACHTAVRAGQALSAEEMRALIGQLERCWSPQACAHGRPTMVHLSQAQLEREFGRR